MVELKMMLTANSPTRRETVAFFNLKTNYLAKPLSICQESLSFWDIKLLLVFMHNIKNIVFIPKVYFRSHF